jgi:hypothetical protein
MVYSYGEKLIILSSTDHKMEQQEEKCVNGKWYKYKSGQRQQFHC